MFASTPINTAFNYDCNQSSRRKGPARPQGRGSPAETQMCTNTGSSAGLVNMKKQSALDFWLSVIFFINPQLSPPNLIDPADATWIHIWYQNSSKRSFMFSESLWQGVKGTHQAHPKPWSNDKRMSAGGVCQLPKPRGELVFLWRGNIHLRAMLFPF